MKPSKLEKKIKKELKKTYDLKFEVKVTYLIDGMYKVAAANNYTIIDEEYLKRKDYLEDLTSKIYMWIMHGQK